MNQIHLVGRIVRPIEVKKLSSDQQVVNNVLAVQRNYRNQQGETEADFIPFVAWNGMTKILENYCQKGQQIALSGRMRSRDYEDSAGARRYVLECVVEDITLLAGSQPNRSIDRDEFVDMGDLSQALVMELAN